MRALTLALLLVACTRPIREVRNVTVHTTIEPMRCKLPELPKKAMIVGYPNGALTDLLITRTDLAGILAEMDLVREYLAAVAKCIGTPN